MCIHAAGAALQLHPCHLVYRYQCQMSKQTMGTAAQAAQFRCMGPRPQLATPNLPSAYCGRPPASCLTPSAAAGPTPSCTGCKTRSPPWRALPGEPLLPCPAPAQPLLGHCLPMLLWPPSKAGSALCRYDEYHMDEYPSGTNAVVAVLAYTGSMAALRCTPQPCPRSRHRRRHAPMSWGPASTGLQGMTWRTP
jgi:hypothetical protein